ncbi:hypothetical protein F5146DRAFT_1130436 [Armillaria mellea]|nr:hypothetical protein F5146DRAFT_1130436 [Armillaria mellea]
MLMVSQDICGHFGHGLHAHANYISMVVNHYPMNQCAAFAQKTCLMQRCTCEAQCYEHIAAYNLYCIPEPWTVLRYFNPDSHVPSPSTTVSSTTHSPFSPHTMPSSNHSTAMFSNATSIPITLTYIPSSSPNINPPYSYNDTVIFTPTGQPIVELTVPQIKACSHSEVENSYGVQYQDDDFSVNIQDSRERFHQDYAYIRHGCLGRST